MRITQDDLEEYNEGDIVMTRSFLSTSKKREVAICFLGAPDKVEEVQSDKDDERQPIMCIYKVIYPQISLYLMKISVFEQEEEVLITPFAIFQVMKIEDVQMDINDESYPIKVIYLDECESTLV